RALDRGSHLRRERARLELRDRASHAHAVGCASRSSRFGLGRRRERELVARPRGIENRERASFGGVDARSPLLVQRAHALRVVDQDRDRGRGVRDRVLGRERRTREGKHEKKQRERAQKKEEKLAKTKPPDLARLELTQELRRRKRHLG